jgi:hypothetical protein
MSGRSEKGGSGVSMEILSCRLISTSYGDNDLVPMGAAGANSESALKQLRSGACSRRNGEFAEGSACWYLL